MKARRIGSWPRAMPGEREVDRGDVAERVLRLGQCPELRVGELAIIAVRFLARREDRDDLGGLVRDERLEDQPVDQGEDRGVHADRQRQRDDGHGEEGGRFSQHPEGEAEVSKHGVHLGSQYAYVGPSFSSGPGTHSNGDLSPTMHGDCPRENGSMTPATRIPAIEDATASYEAWLEAQTPIVPGRPRGQASEDVEGPLHVPAGDVLPVGTGLAGGVPRRHRRPAHSRDWRPAHGELRDLA